MDFVELLEPTEQAAVFVEIKDRRRLGRSDQVSPHLIPLLRNPATVDIPAQLPGKVDVLPLGEGQAFVKGLIIALAISAALWAGIIGAACAVLH